MRKQVTLYNVFFPVFFLLLFPSVWLIVLPVNFVVDLLVLTIGYRYLVDRVPLREAIRALGWPALLSIWIFGFIADILGGLLLIGFSILDVPQGAWSNTLSAIIANPFRDIGAFLLVAFAIALVGLLIYLFAYHRGLRKSIPDPASRQKLSLALAICTAPYLFLLPTEWLYSFAL